MATCRAVSEAVGLAIHHLPPVETGFVVGVVGVVVVVGGVVVVVGGVGVIGCVMIGAGGVSKVGVGIVGVGLTTGIVSNWSVNTESEKSI